MGVGRKPKLAIVKKAEGDRSHAGKDKIGQNVVMLGAPLMPDHFDAERARLWAFLVRSLPKTLLCRADSSILERYVVAWDRYRKIDKEIIDDGMTVKTPQGCIRHPLLAALNAVSKEMAAAGSELGLSPVARMRLNNTALKEDDPMGWLLGDE